MLVIGPSWVGDMVMAQSLFITLKQRDPDITIDVLAPAWSKPLLERMPEVRKAIDMPLGHGVLDLKSRYRIGRQLRANGYSQAIVLPNSWKSALIPLFARIPKRSGWKGEARYGLLNDLRILDKQRYPLMVERFNALALPAQEALSPKQPYPRLEVDHTNALKLAEKFVIPKQRPILVLCPGAEFGPAKRWPEAHYVKVADAKIDDGWQVLILGSEKDRSIAETIRKALNDESKAFCHVLAGNTTLEQAIDLMSLAGAVVSNDSGLMHIAAALNRPLVVVYGSTSPSFTPPLSDTVSSLSIPVDCGPCFQRECPLGLAGHMKCLNELSPESVLKALAEQVRP